MDLGITGKTALVTASSKGLGRAAAVALANDGAKIAICGRDVDTLSQSAHAMRALGADVLAIPADVTEEGAPAHLVERTVEHFGSLDILVANAGGPPPGRAMEVTDEQLHAALNANFLTSVRLVREATPHMTQAGWGRVCLITSVSVKQPIPGLALSNAARTALWAWAKTAAHDLGPSGITLNLACPGHHATDRMKDLGVADQHMGNPADFGAVVAFLCSQHAGFITGSALAVDGGAVAGLL